MKIALIMAAVVVLAAVAIAYFADDAQKAEFRNKYFKKRAVDARQRGKAHYIGGPSRSRYIYQENTGRAEKKADHFMSDAYHWPTGGTFGNLADTNPHGNYAGHADMWYPVYNDAANWSWGRAGYGSGRSRD